MAENAGPLRLDLILEELLDIMDRNINELTMLRDDLHDKLEEIRQAGT